MLDLNKIQENSIIICDSETKEEIVKQMALFPKYRIKFISKKELVDALYFTYDDNAIVYLMQKGFAYVNAKEILDNIKGIEKGSNKLDSLYEIYVELLNNNLLKKNELFRHIFKDKGVYVVGYSSKDKELKYILDQLNIKYEFIEKEVGQLRPTVYEFNDMDSEVKHFFIEVCKLKNKGISLNDIYLYSYPSEYDWILKKYAHIYGLPIEFKSDMRLFEVDLFKKYLKLLDECDFEEAFDRLGIVAYQDYAAYQKLVNIVNDSINLNVSDKFKINYIIEKAKLTNLKSKKYEEAIRIVSSSFNKSGYVFMLGFSMGDYPKVIKDVDLLSDEEKKICHKNTSLIENSILFKDLLIFVTSTKNLYISRKKYEGKEEKYDCDITKNYNLPKVSVEDDYVRYNKILAELEVASHLDDEYNYGIYHELCSCFGENGKSFRYRMFDHDFKWSPSFSNNSHLKLSYSQINEYYKCPFMYFVKRLCVKGAFEDTFYTKLGSLFHELLEKSLTEDVDINSSEVSKAVEERFISPKERFFIKLLLPQVVKVIEKNKFFINNSKFNMAYGEQDHSFNVADNTSLCGAIDKILVNEEDKEVIVVDYKTGNLHFDASKVPYGLDLQLPTYGILLKNLYPEYKQVGAYIQRICVTNPEDENAYLLDGITLNDVKYVYHIEKGIDEKSKFIKGVSLKKSGDLKSNKSLIDENIYEDLLVEADKSIQKAIKKIRMGKFDIYPSLYKDESYCKDCPLGAICFHDASDYRRLTPSLLDEESDGE